MTKSKKLSPVVDFTVSGTTLTMTSAVPIGIARVIAKVTNTVDYVDDFAVEGTHLVVHI